MKKKILTLNLFVLFSLIFFLFVVPVPTYANPLEDFINNVKSTLSSGVDNVKNSLNKDDKNIKSNDVVIDANISLAPNGDIDNNGQIDNGDLIRFTYTIKNNTDNNYSYSTLKTNIDRKQINFIHNLDGASGLLDQDGTVTFPNLRINAKEQRTISFDCRVIFSTDDKVITTEPEFISSDKSSLKKSAKVEISSKKLDPDELKKRLKNSGILKQNIQNQ